ncbi:DUF4363 family protein [Clostridium polynesiense]|uniref:DUF4363 family protein n=1 Tax=Clostridium polynesiense TaxID=1325933 RepID=UPI00058DF1E5|nr:DUF4363 family protein [Clostridium polynesiense]
MKNVVISIVLFLSLLIFMVYSNKQLHNFCSAVSDSCEELEALLKDDEWDRSYDEACSLLDIVKSEAPMISVFMNHADIDTVSHEVYKLTQYVKQLDKSESLASVHILKHHIDNIVSLQRLSIENIF